MKYALLACVFTLSAAAVAQAAEPAFVSNFGGSSVAVERGGKASAVGVQTLLEAGDRVSAGKGSFVEVKYLADGCAIRVAASHSMVIGASSPCAAAADKSAEAAPAKGGKLPADAQIVPTDAVISAGSAQVINQTGSITRVNRGDGLVELNVGQDLSVGDTVFAGPGSSITLYYPATACEYVVPSETYFAVASTSPCAATAFSGSTGNGLQQTAKGIAGVTTPGQDDNDCKDSNDGGNNDDNTCKAAIWLLGGAVVGGGALAVLALSDNDDGGDNNPATPD